MEDKPEARLVVIDPGGTNSHKNADVRAVLAPLADLAAHHRLAIVAVHHLNKSNGSKAQYRMGGSLAFIAAARAGWLLKPAYGRVNCGA